MQRLILSVLILFCVGISYSFSAQKPNSGDSDLPKFRLIKDNINRTESQRTVKVENRQLLVDFDHDGRYLPYLIRGVAYSAIPIGRYPSDWGDPYREDNLFADEGILARDFSLLKKMGANTLRITKGENTLVTLEDAQNPNGPWYQDWESIGRNTSYLTEETLQFASDHNLKIIAGFWMPWPGFRWYYNGVEGVVDYTKDEVRDYLIAKFRNYVSTFRNSPNRDAMLFWAIGNESTLYMGGDVEQISAYYSLCNEMAAQVRMIEGADYRPVAIVNGDLNYIGEEQYGASDNDLNNIDIWGSNVYWGESFGTLFDDFVDKSKKAFWISEYGADAWHTNDLNNPEIGYEDQITQARWASELWDEIENNFNSKKSIGASIMAYADEWWKPAEFQDSDTHDYDGIPVPVDPNIAPDDFFNEEWWGIVSIAPGPNRADPDVVTPREVYHALRTNWLTSQQEPSQAPAKYE